MESKQLDIRSIKSGYSYVSFSLLISLIGVIVVPVYMIYLSPEEYGIFSLFLSAATFLVPLLSLSGDAILARLYFFNNTKSLSRARLMGALISSTIFNCIIMSFALLIILKFIVSSFHQFISVIDYKYLILCSANSIVFIKLYERLLKSKQDIVINPILKISRTLIQISLSLLFLIYFDLNYESLIYGFSFAALIIGLISAISFLCRFKPNVNITSLKVVYGYTLPLIPNRIAAYAINPSINFLIFSFLNLSLVGIYNIAFLVVNVVVMVFQKIHESFQPWLYQELFQLKPDLKKIKESTRLLFISLKLVTIMGMIVIPFALEAIFPKYFFGQKQFIQILCLFPFINASKSLAVSLLMKNESGGYFISFGTYLFIFLLFLFGFLLIPFFGITGAASSLVLSRYLSSELTIYFLLRDKNMKYISYFNKNRQTIIPIYLICLINLFINILFGVNLDMLPTFILICLLIFLIFFHKNDLKIIINTLKFW